ncbi:MAG: protein kinase [Acetatifactor sp.]
MAQLAVSGDNLQGDFGIARTINLVTDMSQKGTYNYMAPEVYRGGSYDATVDIYSLGIVLYRLLNNNRLPFMPPYPQEITYSDKENAVFRRLSCEQLPLPAQGSPLLQNVVMRACQPNPLYRYRTAEDMLYDLECIERGDSSERFYYSAQETASRFDKTEELVPDNSEQERPVSVANNIGLIDQWQEHRLKKAQEKELRQEVIREHKRKKRKRRRVIRLLLVLVLLLFLLREKALIDKGESEKSVIVKLSDMAEQKIESFWETLMSDYGIPQEISDLVIPPGK